MDGAFEWIRGHIHGEWATVTGAPMLFGMAVAIAGTVLFFLLRAHFRERMEALRATIDHKDSVLNEYRDKLHGATPIEVAEQIVRLNDEVSALKKRVSRPQRRLTDEQRSKLKELLAAEESLKGCIIGLSSTTDTATSRFASSLCDVMHEAGVQGWLSALGRHDEGEFGIVFYRPENYSGGQSETLVSIFEKVGLHVTRTTDKNAPEMIYIFIAPEED